MVDINLLPWREQQVRYQKRVCVQLFLMSILMTLSVLIAAHYFFTAKNEVLANELDHLKAQNQIKIQVESKLSQQNLALHIEQMAQKQTYHLFAALAEAPSESLCMNSVKHEGDHITFNGQAASVAMLIHFLRHWDGMPLFSEVKISSLKQVQDHFEFQLDGIKNVI